MLSKNQITVLTNYWHDSSKEKLKTMKSLYKTKRYADCLFFGHLVIEMILKALIVKNSKESAPYSHNLLSLAKLANLNLSAEEWELLEKVKVFNLRTRYPDAKLEFYKLCTKNYTEKYYSNIIELYKKLCQSLRSKS